MSSLGPQVTVLDALNLRLETDPDGLYLDFAMLTVPAKSMNPVIVWPGLWLTLGLNLAIGWPHY